MQTPRSQRFPNPKCPTRTGEIVTVGRVEDLPPGKGATVELAAGGELALYNVNGQFYAVENFCPHRGAPLADGHLRSHFVECDWHGWRFDLRSGQCLTQPDGAIEAYPVIIDDGWIKIEI